MDLALRQPPSPEGRALAERWQAPVIMTNNGCGAIDSDYPLAYGMLAGQSLWPSFDVVLAVGTRMLANLDRQWLSIAIALGGSSSHPGDEDSHLAASRYAIHATASFFGRPSGETRARAGERLQIGRSDALSQKQKLAKAQRQR